MQKIKWHIINGSNMRRTMLAMFCCVLLGNLQGCAFINRADYLEKSNRSEQEQAYETMQSIIDALEAKDTESLKDMFSSYAIDNADDLDGKIEELMDFYPGSDEGFNGLYETEDSSNYGVKTIVINATYDVYNEGQVYYINFSLEVRNDLEPEKEGLHLIQVMTDEAMPDGFTWKEEDDEPGIYILE